MPTESSSSIGELFLQLTRQISTLVRQEISLAQAEVQQNAANIRRDIILMAVGGAILYAGFIVMLGTGIILLVQALSLEWWQSALAVSGGTIVVGAVLLIAGQVALRRARIAPRNPLRTLTRSREAHA